MAIFWHLIFLFFFYHPCRTHKMSMIPLQIMQMIQTMTPILSPLCHYQSKMWRRLKRMRKKFLKCKLTWQDLELPSAFASHPLTNLYFCFVCLWSSGEQSYIVLPVKMTHQNGRSVAQVTWNFCDTKRRALSVYWWGETALSRSVPTTTVRVYFIVECHANNQTLCYFTDCASSAGHRPCSFMCFERWVLFWLMSVGMKLGHREMMAFLFQGNFLTFRFHLILKLFLVMPLMELKPNAGSDRAWVWNTHADFADEEPKPELLALRFLNAESKISLHWIIRCCGDHMLTMHCWTVKVQMFGTTF